MIEHIELSSWGKHPDIFSSVVTGDSLSFQFLFQNTNKQTIDFPFGFGEFLNKLLKTILLGIDFDMVLIQFSRLMFIIENRWDRLSIFFEQ